MKKFLLLIICVCAPVWIFAQQAVWKKNQIKFVPTKTLNILNPGLGFSYQRNYGRFASQISGTYLTDVWGTSYRDKLKGYGYGFEEKYFFPIAFKKFPRVFISSELGYLNFSYIRNSQNFVPVNEYGKEDEQNSYVQNLDLNRQSIILNIRGGMEFKFKQIVVDWSPGFGIVHHNVQHLNKRNSTDSWVSSYEDFMGILTEQEGKYFVMNFTVSIKVGYMF